MKFKTFTIRPQDGGRLIKTTGDEWVGITNFVKKENFRREKDQFISREGWGVFNPTDSELGEGSLFIANERINLICQFYRPNGDQALIIGTPTRLYRTRVSFEEGFRYWEESYSEPGYVASSPVSFEEIANTSHGNRWEAKSINGYLVLNNGLDLPLVYRTEWTHAKPMYELREQGVVRVGAIEDWMGYLWIGDISEVSSSDLADIMRSEDPYRNITDDDGYTVNRTQTRIAWSSPAEPTRWAPLYPGRIRVSSFNTLNRERTSNIATIETIEPHELTTGSVVTLTGIGGDGYSLTAVSVTVLDGVRFTYASTGDDETKTSDIGGTVTRVWAGIAVTHASRTSGVAKVKSPGHGLITGDIATISLTDTDYNATGVEVVVDGDYIFYGNVGSDEAEDAATGTVTPVFSNDVYVMQYPCASINDGIGVHIQGAGPLGAVLTTERVSLMSLSGYRITLTGPAVRSSDGPMYAADTSTSNSGYYDITDKGGRITRMLTLGESMIVYRSDGYFIGYPSGETEAGRSPAIFRKRYGKQVMLPVSPHAVANDRNLRHIWMGRDGWYMTTLDSVGPEIFTTMHLASDAWKDVTDSVIEKMFTFENELTKEIWFCTPTSTVCYSYEFDDASTIDHVFTAGATIARPTEDKFSQTLIWPVIAYDRRIWTYGYDNTRDGRSYVCTLKSGRAPFVIDNAETRLREYSLVLGGNRAGMPMNVRLYGSMTTGGAESMFAQADIPEPFEYHQLNVFGQFRYFGDEVSYVSNGDQIGVSQRVFDVGAINSRGWTNRL